VVTVLEDCTTEGQRSVVLLFRWQKNPIKRIFIKEMFPVYGGSVCSLKLFTTGSRNVANLSAMTKRLKRKCGSG
jgi:hypothetical protein